MKGKRILVTGNTGFKGTWLCDLLAKEEAILSGYALPPENPPFFYFPINQHLHDIRDFAALQHVLQEEKPDVIFHLAAETIVRKGFENPRTTFETNFMGTLNLLEASRSLPSCKTIVIITTDKVYRPGHENAPFSEEDPLGGLDPYSCSKSCVELLVESYRSSFYQKGPLIATARAGNVIGGGDFAKDRLVPDIVKALHTKKPLHLRYPDAIRPWQHVLDALHGYVLLAQKLAEGDKSFEGAWNFGPPENACIPVRELVERAFSYFGTAVDIVIEEPHEKETKILRLSSTKAKQKLGFTPQFSLDEALHSTFAWYKTFYLS